jgi:sporulation protein YlmC with PRC-barrel domain
MIKISAIAAALMMTTAALAQTATSNWIEIEDDDVQVTGLNVSVEDLEDMDLVTADGEDVGEVDEVLGTEPGIVTAVAIEIDEGLFDDKTIIIPITELTVADGDLVTQMTEDQIEAMPDQDD